MASQTDKKEEFRKYLEKSNVLATLTNILTDLFEMEVKPDDPGQYLYQKFGESLKKSSTAPSHLNHGQRETPLRDSTMTDLTLNPTAETGTPVLASQDLAVSAPVTNNPTALRSVSVTAPAETEAVNSRTNQSAQVQSQVEPSAQVQSQVEPSAQTQPQIEQQVDVSAPMTGSGIPGSTARETTVVTHDTNSNSGSTQRNPSASQAQLSDAVIHPVGSRGPRGDVPISSNATGSAPAPPVP